MSNKENIEETEELGLVIDEETCWWVQDVLHDGRASSNDDDGTSNEEEE